LVGRQNVHPTHSFETGRGSVIHIKQEEGTSPREDDKDGGDDDDDDGGDDDDDDNPPLDRTEPRLELELSSVDNVMAARAAASDDGDDDDDGEDDESPKVLDLTTELNQVGIASASASAVKVKSAKKKKAAPSPAPSAVGAAATADDKKRKADASREQKLTDIKKRAVGGGGKKDFASQFAESKAKELALSTLKFDHDRVLAAEEMTLKKKRTTTRSPTGPLLFSLKKGFD